MRSDFAGTTARYYAGFRRDLPADQTERLVAATGLRAGDIALDLGCGTGRPGVSGDANTPDRAPH
ncbi:hypothetical protein [Leifsonia sp. P73]|uniref:hypothetical protein n=1 Tax=Leifsonia sp. P73 TaxID=3423959 RepID=UPI003DA56F82